MTPTHRLICAAVVLLGIPLAGLAAGGEMEMYEQLDTNRDGSIDPEEAGRSAQATAEFRQMDADGDGKVAREEWQAYFSPSDRGQAGPAGGGVEFAPSTNPPDAASPSPERD